jgi:hypothetical protein
MPSLTTSVVFVSGYRQLTNRTELINSLVTAENGSRGIVRVLFKKSAGYAYVVFKTSSRAKEFLDFRNFSILNNEMIRGEFVSRRIMEKDEFYTLTDAADAYVAKLVAIFLKVTWSLFIFSNGQLPSRELVIRMDMFVHNGQFFGIRKGDTLEVATVNLEEFPAFEKFLPAQEDLKLVVKSILSKKNYLVLFSTCVTGLSVIMNMNNLFLVTAIQEENSDKCRKFVVFPASSVEADIVYEKYESDINKMPENVFSLVAIIS